MPKSNQDQTEHPKKAWLPLRAAALGLAALVLVPVIAIIALHVPYVQKQIISGTVNKIESISNYKVELGSYKWWPFSRLYLSGIKVQSGDRLLLDCAEVRLSYGFSSSWPYIIPEELYLEKPFFQLEKTPDGKWSVPGKALPRLGGERDRLWEQIPPPNLRIVSGIIEARQGDRVVLTIRDVTGLVRLKIVHGPDGPEINVDLDNLRSNLDIADWGKWTVEGSCAFRQNELTTEGITIISAEGPRVELRGRWNIADFENGKVEAIFSGLSSGAAPMLPPALSRLLDGASGTATIARASGKWSIAHEIQAPLGLFKGSLDVEKAVPGQYEARLTSAFSGLGAQGIKLLPEMELNGLLALDARFTDGRFGTARFSARLDPSKIGSDTIQGCEFAGTYENGVISLKSGAVKSSVADFRLSAVADIAGLFDPGHKGEMKAQIAIEKANLEKISSKMPHRLGGTVSVEAGYDPGNFRELRLWYAKADANLNIPDFVALKGSGLYRSEQLKIDYELDCKEVQRLAALYPGWEGKGRVASRGTIAGRWPDLSWEGDINSQRFQYASGQADQVSVKGKGKLTGKDERRELNLKAQNVLFDGKKIASVVLDLDQQKDGCAFQFRGEGILNQISARLSGRLDRIWDFPHVAVSTQGQLGFKDQSGAFEAKFEIEKDGLKIGSASLQNGKQRIVLSGGTISDAKTDLRLSLESISAGHIISLFGIKEVFTGLVSGQIQVSGKPDQPECRLSMQAANCLIKGRQKIEQVRLQGTLNRDTVVFEGQIAAQGVNPPLGFTGRIPLRLSLRPFQFEIRQTDEMSCDLKIGGLEAVVLLPYISFLTKAGGVLQGDVHVAGSLKQPVVSGSGIWKDGSFQQIDWPHIIENIHADWTLDSKNIYVKRAETSHLGGSVIVTGWVDYPRFNTMYWSANGTDLLVRDIFGIEGKVSGSAELNQTPETADLTGTLRFSKAAMNLGQLETDLARNIQIIEASARGDKLEIKDAKNPSRFYHKLRMDVGLELPQYGTWVSGKGLKTEITGELKLGKAPAGPIKLTGELQALKGTYSFQSKELKISEGTLVFTGTPQPDPQLRIVSQKEVRDITLQAIVSGPLSRPKLAMSSIPAMNQVDILSYFMFEHPAGDLSASEKTQLQTRAASWLGSETSNVIRGVFGNSPFAPDSVGYRSTTGKTEHGFSYRPDTGAPVKETGIVEIGKYVTPDLHVTYGRAITGEQGNEVQLEYRVNRRLSVQTQVGGADQTGIDVFWRHDFGK